MKYMGCWSLLNLHVEGGEDGWKHACLALEVIFFATNQNPFNGFPISGLFGTVCL